MTTEKNDILGIKSAMKEREAIRVLRELIDICLYCPYNINWKEFNNIYDK